MKHLFLFHLTQRRIYLIEMVFENSTACYSMKVTLILMQEKTITFRITEIHHLLNHFILRQ